MALAIHTEPIPLATNSDGVVCVAGTRITLDTIVAAFNEGATAEEIVQQYPSLYLADVYSVISYYLRDRATVDEYLQQRQLEGNTLRKQNQARFDSRGIRDRLIARRKEHGATQ